MEDDDRIDWQLISEAMNFYKSVGFTEITVPWHVMTEVSNITCPSPDKAYPFEDGLLVGSAEQSLIQMGIAGKLETNVPFVTCTPCFRNEYELDRFHQKYFMKVELFIWGEYAVASLMGVARKFFRTKTGKILDLSQQSTGFDLEINGVEIGSYSYRKFRDHSWTCGTGLALPRFSKVRHD